MINFPSRLTTNQTLGGAWVDSFGAGLPTIQISGTTGWGQGSRPDGEKQFDELYYRCFSSWHILRDKAVKIGKDPDLVSLIFVDALDTVSWVVAPQNFVIKRNKSRPLLVQYNISMSKVRRYIGKDLSYLFFPPGAKMSLGIDSLDDAIKQIQGFFNWITGGIMSVLGPIQNAIAKFTALTARVLTAVKSAISSVLGAGSITGSLLSMAGNLTRAGANILHAVQSVIALPSVIAAKFSRAASGFMNAFCLVSNIFSSRKFIPNYDSLYGASNCSSTAGGNNISRYNTENPFAAMSSINQYGNSINKSAFDSLSTAINADWAKNPPSQQQLTHYMSQITSGITA